MPTKQEIVKAVKTVKQRDKETTTQLCAKLFEHLQTVAAIVNELKNTHNKDVEFQYEFVPTNPDPLRLKLFNVKETFADISTFVG